MVREDRASETDHASVSFETTDRGVVLRLDSPAGTVEGRLAARLMFYVDETNNMDGHFIEDRTRYEHDHDRDPVAFFTDPGAFHRRRSEDALTLVDEQDGFRAELTIAPDDGAHYAADFRVRNVAADTQRLMVARFGLADVTVDGHPPDEWLSSPIYKYQHYTRGDVSAIPDTDLRLIMAPVGTVEPVVWVGDIGEGPALEFSPWLENYGSMILDSDATVEAHMFVDRYLELGDEHYLGTTLLRSQSARWRDALSEFTATVPPRMGYEPSGAPGWVHGLRLATFPERLFPIGDERWRPYFEWAADNGFDGVMGFGWMWQRHDDIICAIAPDEDGELPLDGAHGATEESVQRHNEMLHDLGMKSIVWTPTTGASPYAGVCEEHPEWFVRDEDGELRGSWYDGDGDLWLVDSNPLSEGYHRYWRDLVFDLVDWGFDGAFLDGIIARPSDHFDRPYPGAVHDAAYEATARLRRELDDAGHDDFVLKPEAGDVWLARSTDFSNLPEIGLDKPVAPSDDIADDVLGQSRAWTDDDYPTLDPEAFTDQLELGRRCWPDDMPGGCVLLENNPEQLIDPELAVVELRHLTSSVVSFPLETARDDPEFAEFDGTPDADLSDEAATMRRRLFERVRRLNEAKDEHAVLSRGTLDFDAVGTDHGAVPAFARTHGDDLVLVIANVDDSTRSVTLSLSDTADLPLPDTGELACTDLRTDEPATFGVDDLQTGVDLELASGELHAWLVD